VDVTSLVQQLVNAGTWMKGSPINFIITKSAGTGWRNVSTFDAGAGKRPRLHIDYTFNGRPNLAANKTTTYSSGGGAYTGANAVDENPKTRWGSEYLDNSWIYVDLGDVYLVDSVFIFWEDAAAIHYSIQVANTPSNTDAGWTTVSDIVDGTNSEQRVIKFAPVTARYVRMRGYTRTTAYGYSMFEYEVYGNCIAPAITVLPVNQSVLASAQASFSITASGSGVILYQWQDSVSGGIWNNVTNGTGATSGSYSFTSEGGDNGKNFRCKVTSSTCGPAVYSNVVTCTVCSQPVVTANPVNRNDTVGKIATFAVSAGGTPALSYQWQVSADNGVQWTDVQGAQAATYAFTNTAANNGWQYRCVVSTGCFTPAVSTAATLTVCTPPVITQQPVSLLGKQVGETASFGVTVAAESTSPSYQWQRSVDNAATWTNVTNGTGATAVSYSFTVGAGDGAALFRCAIVNPCGQVNSNTVSVGVCTPASIVTQPSDQSLNPGQSVTFSVVASGDPSPSYQWRSRVNSGSAWADITAGGNGPLYGFTSDAGQNGRQFSCLVSNGCGASVISSTATLTVCAPPQVVTDPGNQDKNPGDTAVFSITGTGTSLSYQWQKSLGGVTWINVDGGIGGTTATYRFVSVSSDNNSLVRCMLTNGCGKDTSGVATLNVCNPPLMVTSPRDTGVASGASASFSVSVTGTAPVYQWQKSGDGKLWANIINETAASYIVTAEAADNGAKFRCRVKNNCGDVYSTMATLTVCLPCSITAQTISDKTVVIGDSISFGITALGANLTYAWQKKRANDSLFRPITDAITASYFFTASVSDSAALFRCVVQAVCGAPATSRTAQVIAYSPLIAAFSASDSLGPAPLTVQFADLSTDKFTRRMWDFGDSSALDTSTQAPSHLYTKAGIYTAKLTISAPAPHGTVIAQKQIFIWGQGENPVRISGVSLTPSNVVVTFTNYTNISPPTPFLSADSVALWYKPGAAPLATGAPALLLKEYSLSALRSRGAVYNDTLTVPALSMPDTTYGFANVVVWNDRAKTAIKMGNTVTVLMKDTLLIVNDLVISGVYLPNDTARISLENLSKLDTSNVDSVVIWYGLSAAAIVDFSDRNSTRRLSAKDVVGAGLRYSLFIVNPLFNNQKTTMRAAVVLIGKNARRSNIRSASFDVGKDRPINPVRLSATTLSANRIRLSWNNIAGTAIERMVIWYRTQAPVPLLYDVTTLTMNSLVPNLSDTVIIGDKFNEKSRYYFGAQVFQNGIWSLITNGASATDSTPEAGADLPVNSAAITTLWFDTLVNEIKVVWSVAYAQAESLQVGISYSTISVPSTSPDAQQVVDVVAPRDSASIKIRGNIIFDQTYYISLWLRRPGGKWAGPSFEGLKSVYVPQCTWQSVVYFSKEKDTVFAFNNAIRIINTPGDLSLTSNTVVRFDVAPPALGGFVPVGPGFEFSAKESGIPFYVGIKTGSLPAGSAISDVRMFRRTAAGLWIMDEKPLFIDKAGGYVSVLTNMLDFPFVPMVDTLKPRYSAPPDLEKAVVPDISITDTVYVSDNVANVFWRFKTAKGGSSFDYGDTGQSGRFSDTTGRIIVTTPGGFVSPDNGMRGYLVISDGTNTDTVNLSRSVVRAASGIIRTVEMKWTPLSVPMVLDTVEAKQTLSSLAVGRDWIYDPTRFRLFRWSPGAVNEKEQAKWVEYSEAMKSAFEFSRASLLWIKTRDKADVRFGRGITPSLRDSFAISLPPANWTDFSLPFKFDIRLGDVLRASSKAGLNVDTLQVYAWAKDTAGRYRSEPVFINRFASLNNRDTMLSSSGAAGFSVFNPTSDTIKLIFPPLSAALSKTVVAKKTDFPGWAIKLSAGLSDGTLLTSFYCGFAKTNDKDVSYFPQAPSFSQVYAGVFDVAAKKVYGHAVSHSINNGGTSYLLVFGNSSAQKEVVSYRIDNRKYLPEGMKARVYNAVAGRYEDAPAKSLNMAIEPGCREYRWLLVGTDEYLANARFIAEAGKLMLAGTWPNPFKNFVRIRYSLPYEGVDKVRFAVYDLRGKTIWNTEIATGPSYGANELVWNARANNGQTVAAGMYILRMIALDKAGAQAGVFEKRMMMVR
jgi:PKD repeat protein